MRILYNFERNLLFSLYVSLPFGLPLTPTVLQTYIDEKHNYSQQQCRARKKSNDVPNKNRIACARHNHQISIHITLLQIQQTNQNKKIYENRGCVTGICVRVMSSRAVNVDAVLNCTNNAI